MDEEFDANYLFDEKGSLSVIYGLELAWIGTMIGLKGENDIHLLIM